MQILHGRSTFINRALEYFVVFCVVVALGVIAFVMLGNALAESRDARRLGDIAAIRQALELYAVEHGTYPTTGWVTSGNASWGILETQLRPYLTSLPVDPRNETDGFVQQTGAFTYAYYSTDDIGTLGGRGDYLLVFRAERPQQLMLYQQATTTLSSNRTTFLLTDLTGVEGVFALRAP